MPASFLSPHFLLTHLLYVCMLSGFSCVQLFVTLWTVACQAPLSMGFSRQEYWSGFPCPPPRHLSDPGVKLTSLMFPAWASRFFTISATWEAPSPVLLTYIFHLLNLKSNLNFSHYIKIAWIISAICDFFSLNSHSINFSSYSFSFLSTYFIMYLYSYIYIYIYISVQLDCELTRGLNPILFIVLTHLLYYLIYSTILIGMYE